VITKTSNLKLTVGGAGSLYAPELIEHLVRTPTVLNKIGTITLFDANPQRLEIVAGFCQRVLAAQQAQVNLVTTTEPAEAFNECDVLFNMIRSGHRGDVTEGMQARFGDEMFPLQDGLFGQETLGLGGLRSFVRQTQVMDEWFPLMPKGIMIFNFANPAGMLSQYVFNASIKPSMVIGLCNIPFELRVQIAIGLQARHPELRRFSAVELARHVDIDSLGVNHMSFFRGFTYEGRDIFGEVIDCITKPPANFDPQKNIENLAIYIEIAKKYGVFPSWYWQYRMDLDGTVKDLSAQPKQESRAWKVRQWERQQLLRYKNSTEPIDVILADLMQRGGANYSKMAVLALDGVLNSTGERHIVNVPNVRPGGTPYLPWLPRETFVEVPCTMTANGPLADPNMDTSLPAVFQEAIRAEVLAQNYWVDAHLYKGNDNLSRDFKRASLIDHPLIGQRIPFSAREATIERILGQIDQPWFDPEWPRLAYN
jgi:6-phospho-beta-glucosidase